MNVTLLDLAHALTAVDTERTCPFCTKQAWGADQHAAGCPFHLAYRAIQQAGTHALALNTEHGVSDQG